MLPRGSCGEDSGIFWHIDAVFTANFEFYLLDIGVLAKRKDAGDDLPERINIVHRLMFGCNPFGGLKIGVIFDIGVVVSPDVVNDLVTQREDSFFMRYLVLMDMDG
jgi:hypothetical protein